MTCDRKAEGEPGRYLHVVDVAVLQRRRECMVGLDMNLCEGDRVLQGGNIGEPTRRTRSSAPMYALVW